MARATELEITKSDAGYRFKLSRVGEPFKAAKKVWPVKPNAQVVSSKCHGIEAAVVAANKSPDKPSQSPDAFIAAGRGLHRALFPSAIPELEELRNALRRLRTPLLISTDEPDVYWELLYDEDDKCRGEFFALRYSMGRQLHSRNVPKGGSRNRGKWRCLLIANPNSDEPEWALPGMSKAAVQLKTWLEERDIEVDLLVEEQASFENVLNHLAAHEYDVIHYGGHAIQHKSGEYALRLRREKLREVLLLASDLRDQVRGRPIVFVNACWTAVAHGMTNPPGIVKGLTEAFLTAGAQLVVGSQFEAPIAGARAFAEKFYESVLSGEQVGEALRQARIHVKGKPEFGAAWACFVMYGDPCLQFNLQEDRLSKLLADAKLTGEDLDEIAIHVAESALDYSGGSDVVATVELFAALVDSDTGWLRERLEALNVPVEALAHGFKTLFREINPPTDTTLERKKKTKPRFSDNARAIVREARTIAGVARRAKVAERDLIKAFVLKGGGKTRKILVGLNVDLSDIDPDRDLPSRQLQPTDGVSHNTGSIASTPVPSLNQSDYSPEAWAALVCALDLVRASGKQLFETRFLFWGMYQIEDSALAKALRRLGIRVAKAELGINGKSHPSIPLVSGPTQVSKSVSDILLLARKAAAAERRKCVTGYDLLIGFVQQGGGSVGKLLLQVNDVPPQALLSALRSRLFLDSGDLNPSRMSSEIQQFLESARWLIRHKGHTTIGRRHLLYGMLAAERSLLAKLLREQGKDPTQLADLLHARLTSKSPNEKTVSAPTPLMSSALVTLLCGVESSDPKQEEVLLSEARLLAPFLEHLSADVKEFLIREGVRWRDLIEKANRLAQQAKNPSE